MTTIKFRKYDTYIETGIQWLGKIPESWEKRRVKSVFRLVAEPAPQNNNIELLSVYTDIGVKPRRELEERGNKASTTDGYWIVKKGDIIVNKLLAWMGAIGISKYDGVTSPAYDILRAKCSIYGDYFHYLFRTPNCVSELKKHSKGIMDMRLRLYFDAFGDVIIPYPSKAEQIAIARFLDEKTARIDEAIAKKEKMIALLNERKQIIIQNAVTKGLNPTVKMKDSGVEWIGMIPVHWDVLPGLCFFKENKRSNKGMREETVLSLSYGRIILKPAEKMHGLMPDSYETYQIVEPGDIIIRGTDLQNDKTSLRTGLATIKGIITSAYLNLKADIGNRPDYLHFFLHFLDITKALYHFGTGLRQNLSYQDFKRMPMLRVPIQEQKAITLYIEDQSTKIDNAVNLQEKQIEKLKEYKAVLIDSAVTGKIKII